MYEIHKKIGNTFFALRKKGLTESEAWDEISSNGIFIPDAVRVDIVRSFNRAYRKLPIMVRCNIL